ncbi:maker365 [Drosophila busckii]|uniref:Maker365 n=1 Tax=Drosophila busckii TaxID=30019 RepID=A0A0M4F081_DROBS|nr:maker365 [Drosophila busckii]
MEKSKSIGRQFGDAKNPSLCAVWLTEAALKLHTNLHFVVHDCTTELKAYFLYSIPRHISKRNPQVRLPMVEDSQGAVVCDPHAIMSYLVNQYGRESTLYPSEPLKRALVDQRLFYSSGVLYPLRRQLVRMLPEQNFAELLMQKIDDVYESYAVLDQFVANNSYMAGDHLTIADFAISSTIIVLDARIAPFHIAEYPNLSAWLARMSTLPYFLKLAEDAKAVYLQNLNYNICYWSPLINKKKCLTQLKIPQPDPSLRYKY